MVDRSSPSPVPASASLPRERRGGDRRRVNLGPPGGCERRVRDRRRSASLSVERLDERIVLSTAFSVAAGIGATEDLRAVAVATDSAGSMYVTGDFKGTVDFDPSAATTAATSVGDHDIFVAKYAATGALVWAEVMPGTLWSCVGQSDAIAVDGSGNIFITGEFSGTVDFDPGPGTHVLNSPGRFDAFVARLNPGGSLAWVDDMPGTATDVDCGTGLAVDGSGNVVVTGGFADSATFGSTVLTTGAANDLFVARLDATGNVLWARGTQSTGNATSGSTGVAVDGAGNIDISGFYAGSVDFNPGSGKDTHTAAGLRDGFVLQLDKTGAFRWLSSLGGTDVDQATAVAVDAAGNVYSTGQFTGTAAFDPASGLSLTSAGGSTVFVLKLDATGHFVWVRGMTITNGSATGAAIAVDPATGQVDTAGWYESTVDFDPGPATFNLTSAGFEDVFVSELDGLGGFVGAQSAGGNDFDVANGLARSPTGAIVVVGDYIGLPTFGSATLPSAGKRDAFVTELTTTAATPPAPSAPVLEAGSDSGASNSDNITNDTTPTFDITQAVATDTVDLLRNGAVVASRTGPGAITDPGPLVTGSYVYSARQRDALGNTSPLSTSLTLTILATPPAAPSAPALLATDDSGTTGDGLTNVRQPHLVGTAPAGLTVRLVAAGGTVLGSGTASAQGGYSLTPTNPLADGSYALQAQAVDVAGNLSALSSSFALTIDATAPAAPTTPALAAADDSGTPGDLLTNVRQPHLVGTAQPGCTVQVIGAGGAVLGWATAQASGAYSVGFASPLADGSCTVQVRATDAAANVSPLSGSLTITIDATPPATPAAPALAAADDSGAQGDGITNVAQPHLTGTAEPGALVQALNSGNVVIASGQAAGTGAYSIALASPLADGIYALRVRAQDAAGNVSAASSSLTLTIDTLAPATPATPALAAADDTGTLGDGITTNTQPHLMGSSEPGALVQILSAGGTVLGTGNAGGAGAYSVAFAAPLAPGTYSVRVRAQDVAGNLSMASPAFSLTIMVSNLPTPGTPALALADDSGTVGDNLTNVRQPHLTGTAIAGVTVQLVDSGGTLLGAGPSQSDGTYSVPFSSPLADGTYSVSVRLQDVAGNLSALSRALTFTIDTAPPATPSLTGLAAADDSGTPGDGITNVARPHLVGTADAGAVVLILNGSGTVLGSAVASSTGAYTVLLNSALPEGVSALTARAQDAAGNLSALSAALSLTVDTTPPAAPSTPAVAATDDSGTVGDGVTNVKQPHLVGTASAGVVVQLVDGAGSVLGSASAGTAGAYSVAFPAALADGVYTVQARAQDVAGNLSAPSASFTFTVDATPPATPAAPGLAPGDDTGTLGDGVTTVAQPHLVGAAEANALVQIVDNAGTSLGSALASSTGGYSVPFASPLAVGSYTVRVRAQDAAGNVSASSAAFSFTIAAVAQPPGPPSAPVLAAADDSGTRGDALTNVRQPHLVGTAAPGLTVQILNASGSVVGSALAASDGSYSVLLASPLADGTYAFRARAQDAGGLQSAPSAAGSLTIDATPPAAPAAPALPASDDTGIKGDLATVVRRPHLAGIGEPNATVDLLDMTGAVISTTVAAADGSYIVQPPGNLPNGRYGFEVRARDAAGNQGAPGAAAWLTLGTVAGDYDGDGRTDLAVYRPTTAQWLIMGSRSGPQLVSFGAPGLDVPVPGDYDGSGKTEVAVYRPTTGQWLIVGPSGGRIVQFGGPGDLPEPADYDGDGKTDLAVFRPGTGQWFILRTTAGPEVVSFGAPNLDQPVPSDYDGDGKTDLAVFRPSTGQWFVLRSTAGPEAVSFGAPNLDQPVPCDYDGDGKTDLAVFRPSTGQWFVLRSTAGPEAVSFGAPNLDQPVPADYDGDGQSDLAVYRPNTASWYVLRSTAGALAQSFGAPSLDVPLMASLATRMQAVTAASTSSRTAAVQAAPAVEADAMRAVAETPPPKPAGSSAGTAALTSRAVAAAIEGLYPPRWGD